MGQDTTRLAEFVYAVMREGDELDLVAEALRSQAYTFCACTSVELFVAAVQPTTVGCVIAPVDLADNGIDVILSTLRAKDACLAVCVLGREHDFTVAVGLIKRGASEFVEPPLTSARILAAVKRAVAASHVAFGARLPPVSHGST